MSQENKKKKEKNTERKDPEFLKAKERIEKLKKEINYHRYLYHVLDKQEISDAALDSLKHELYLLEQKYPELITPDSPTQRVGGKPLDKFEKVPHRVPMISLEDAFSPEELYQWAERNQKLVPGEKLDYFVEPKVDGFAISLEYEKGIFVRGSTRGDGKIGEDVTQNLKTIESIPLKLEIHQDLPKKIKKRLEEVIEKGHLEVRGEVYMTITAFEKVNEERKKQGLPLYANPRNTAAGSIRQLDPKVAASRELNFLAYDLVTDVGQETHQMEHQITQALGFKTDWGKYCANLEEVIDFWKEMQEKRKRLPYQIDGLVVTINNNRVFEKLGVVGKAPRGAIAFKFPAQEATTIVEDIVVQVGRTGALTPVAILKPVQIGGATISRATLHNEDEIKRLDIRIGDTVIVQRAGDVIPDIVGVLKRMRTGREKKFKMPKKCPVCGSPVKKEEISDKKQRKSVVWYCTNPSCGAIQKRKIDHFVSKKGFDIVGLGPKIVAQLMDVGLINDPADIFFLKEGDLVPLERFAEKSAHNLIEAIEKSKTIPLAKFIFALGIRHIGEETALILEKELLKKVGRIRTIDDFLRAIKSFSFEELSNIPEIGPVIAQSIIEWFNSKQNLALLEKLSKAGIKLQTPQLSFKKQILKDKTFLFTGELSSMTREEAKAKVRELGGHPVSSPSKRTDFVVVGQNPGSKFEKAKKLGLKIIGEKEFLNLIKG